MLIESTKPLLVRFSTGDIRLTPGCPVEIPTAQARKLLLKAGGKVREVSREWNPTWRELAALTSGLTADDTRLPVVMDALSLATTPISTAIGWRFAVPSKRYGLRWQTEDTLIPDVYANMMRGRVIARERVRERQRKGCSFRSCHSVVRETSPLEGAEGSSGHASSKEPVPIRDRHVVQELGTECLGKPRRSQASVPGPEPWSHLWPDGPPGCNCLRTQGDMSLSPQIRCLIEQQNRRRAMPFVKKVKPAESMSPGTMVLDLPRKAATVTACRQELGKARAREEEFEDQLEHARDEFTKVSAERVADDSLAISAVADAMTAAQNKVDGIEKALGVARQRRADAEQALKEADQNARREELRSHLVRLGAMGKQIDDAMNTLTRVVETIIPILNATRGLGFDLINQKLTSANLLFKIKLLESCKAMPNCAQGESWYLEPAPWSASLPTPDQADLAK